MFFLVSCRRVPANRISPGVHTPGVVSYVVLLPLLSVSSPVSHATFVVYVAPCAAFHVASGACISMCYEHFHAVAPGHWVRSTLKITPVITLIASPARSHSVQFVKPSAHSAPFSPRLSHLAHLPTQPATTHLSSQPVGEHLMTVSALKQPATLTFPRPLALAH